MSPMPIVTEMFRRTGEVNGVHFFHPFTEGMGAFFSLPEDEWESAGSPEVIKVTVDNADTAVAQALVLASMPDLLKGVQRFMGAGQEVRRLLDVIDKYADKFADLDYDSIADEMRAAAKEGGYVNE